MHTLSVMFQRRESDFFKMTDYLLVGCSLLLSLLSQLSPAHRDCLFLFKAIGLVRSYPDRLKTNHMGAVFKDGAARFLILISQCSSCIVRLCEGSDLVKDPLTKPPLNILEHKQSISLCALAKMYLPGSCRKRDNCRNRDNLLTLCWLIDAFAESFNKNKNFDI